MQKKNKANLALGISAAGFVGTLAAGGSGFAAGLFHHGFLAATIGGLADWFAVTALFRKPLGISYRTDVLRRNRKRIGMEELEESIERVVAGPERKSKVISERDKKLTAYHEAGHALIGLLLPNADPVHKVSIIPRGRAGGYTLMLPKEERNYATRSELREQLRTLLGGRVAEALVLEEISTGAQNDLERATELARKMICEFGMSEVLGPITFGRRQDAQVFLGRDIARDRNYSEEVAYSIDKEVRRLIEDAYEKTETMLRENMDKLHLIANALIEKETLEASELEQLMRDGRITEKPANSDDEPEKTVAAADVISAPGAEAAPKVVYNFPEASGGNA